MTKSIFSRRGLARSLACLLLLVWGVTDVRRRASLDPANPQRHRTDLTVYTEAGAAFYEDREPYEATNVRGWSYLYPPLFALVVAPLHDLPPRWQGVAWYLFSLGLSLGCIRECRRLFRCVQDDPVRATATPWRQTTWLAVTATLTVLLPWLNTLQRGQANIAVLYPLMLGFRLLLESRSRLTHFAAGAVLVLPAALKVTPALPAAAVLLWAHFARPADGNAVDRILAPAGAVAGTLMYLFIIPATLIGWEANLRHLNTFAHKVILYGDITPDERINTRSFRNQSLENSVKLLGNRLAYHFADGPDYRMANDPRRLRTGLPMENPRFERIILLARVSAAVLILATAWRLRNRRDRLTGATLFGIAGAATLPISPISWGHHYVIFLPAALFVPLFLLSHGYRRTALALSCAGGALTGLHYLTFPWLASWGLLGYGVCLWSVVVTAAVISVSRHPIEHTACRTLPRPRSLRLERMLPR